MRGAAHILLHGLHGAWRLEVEAAGIETHALADEGELGSIGLAPLQIDETRVLSRRAADRMDRRVVLFEQGLADDCRERRAALLG